MIYIKKFGNEYGNIRIEIKEINIISKCFLKFVVY